MTKRPKKQNKPAYKEIFVESLEKPHESLPLLLELVLSVLLIVHTIELVQRHFEARSARIRLARQREALAL